MNKFKHPIYLSEKQICDQLQLKYHEFFDHLGENFESIREQQIGSIRPDFIDFHKSFINVTEVKITANIDTVRQIVFYKRIIDAYIFEVSRENMSKCPNVSMSIVARNFDFGIEEICAELNIALFRIVLDGEEIIDVEAYDTEYLPLVRKDHIFELKLKETYV